MHGTASARIRHPRLCPIARHRRDAWRMESTQIARRSAGSSLGENHRRFRPLPDDGKEIHRHPLLQLLSTSRMATGCGRRARWTSRHGQRESNCCARNSTRTVSSDSPSRARITPEIGNGSTAVRGSCVTRSDSGRCTGTSRTVSYSTATSKTCCAPNARCSSPPTRAVLARTSIWQKPASSRDA